MLLRQADKRRSQDFSRFTCDLPFLTTLANRTVAPTTNYLKVKSQKLTRYLMHGGDLQNPRVKSQLDILSGTEPILQEARYRI